MGKSNRIRSNRAQKPVSAPRASKKNNKKGLSSRAMSIIAIVVTVAILLMVLAFVLIGKGVPNRLRKSAESENFSINTNMMSYYFYSVYNSFAEEYSDYLTYLSLDTSKSLKDQPFGGDGSQTYYDSYLLGDFSGTWFDYFAEQTKAEVSSMLLYLEEANAREISLTDEEKDSIRESLESSAIAYGYSSNMDSYYSMQYGKGVSLKDVQAAIEYSTLASKVQNEIYNEYETWIKNNPNEIDAKYDSDKKSFDLVDFTYYAFTISYDTVAKDVLGDNYQTLLKDNEENQNKVMDKYREKIEEAKEKAEGLVAITDEKELKSAILDIVLSETYDSTYDTKNGDDKKDTLTEDDLKELRAAMIAEVIEAALAEKTDTEDTEDTENTESIKITETTSKDEEGKDVTTKTATAYGKDVPVAFAEILKSIKESLDTKATTALSTYVLEKVAYEEDEEFSEWAFADGRVAGDTKVITEGDGAEEELTSKTGYTYVSAYVLKTPARRDEDKTRDVAYAIFQTEKNAKNAAAALVAAEVLTTESFEELVLANSSAGNTVIEDCYEGQVGSDVFDEWLFDKELPVGAYTTEPLKLDDSTWAVAYYVADGESNWRVTVKSAILSEKVEAQYAEMQEKYGDSIETYDRAISKIKA